MRIVAVRMHVLLVFFFDGLRQFFGSFHLGVIPISHVFQADLDISASAGYTGGHGICVGNHGVYDAVYIFRIISDVLIRHAFCSTCVDGNHGAESSNGAISEGMAPHRYTIAPSMRTMTGSVHIRWRKTTCKERLYILFIPMKNGSVIR